MKATISMRLNVTLFERFLLLWTV